MGRTPSTAGTGTRSMYLDGLRTIALARVVLYHATNLWTLTAFTAMPLMFIVAGSLYANSIERRPVRRVIVDRYRRILLPYWLYVVALIVLWTATGVIGDVHPLSWISFAMPVLSIAGPQGPPGMTNEMTWIALWYLQVHLILSLIGPWLRTMQLRHGRRFWIALVAAAVLMMPLGIGLGVWAVCWCIGYLQHDGSLHTWMQGRWRPIVAVCGPLGVALFIAFHTSNEAVAGFGALLLGVFWVSLATAMRDRIEPFLQHRRARSFLAWSSSRSLTIYLWHLMIIYAIVELGLPGSNGPWTRAALTFAALPLAVVLFGWAEDLAARKSPTLWPRLPKPRPDAQSVPNMRSPASPNPGTM